MSEVHANISDHFPKLFEISNIAGHTSKMFRSYRNEFRFVQPFHFVNLIVHTTSLLSSHVKVSNLYVYLYLYLYLYVFTVREILVIH